MTSSRSHTALGLLALLVMCGTVLSSKSAHAPLARKQRYDFNHLNAWGYKKECAAYSFVDIPAAASKPADCGQFFKLALANRFNARVAQNQAVSLAGNFGQLRVLDECGKKRVTLSANKLEFRAHSGHTLNGTVFDAELIMYFNRRNCKGPTHAVSLFLNAAKSDLDAQDLFRATFASAAVDSAPIIYQSAHKAYGVSLPKKLRKYFSAGQTFYRYKGSLPTPPLKQDVTWFVFDKPVTVSRDDIEFLNSKYSSAKFLKGNNVAPVQPLNKRDVAYSKISGRVRNIVKKIVIKTHVKKVAALHNKRHGNKVVVKTIVGATRRHK